MILDQYGRPIESKRQASRRINARYDAAQTTDDDRRHWANADGLSSVAANSSCVRKRLRERSRYEIANNSYARGILNTLSAYTVGSGPTLQLTYRGPETEDVAEIRRASQVVEHLWATWFYERKMGQKLSTAQLALDGDGEAFGVLTSSRKASMHTPVQLDLRLYEADHFDLTSWGDWTEDDAGIRIGSDGEPTEYAFQKEHPGDNLASLSKSEWLPADQVIHLYRRERPGQLRGIPKTTPALPLFALLRRFTLATCVAAETAADFAAILYGDQSADEDDILAPWVRLEIERGAMLSAPGGSRLAQLKAEHPNATFDEFVKAILREIARCLGVPAVLALGDASRYNYASGRLDLQGFFRQMEVERSLLLERDMLDRLWESWLDEALLIPGFLPAEFAALAQYFEWSWRWTSPGHVDRAKEAAGQAAELGNHTTTLAREYAKQGLDWETELRQRARELTIMRELGLSMAQAAPSDEPNEDEEVDEEETQAA